MYPNRSRFIINKDSDLIIACDYCNTKVVIKNGDYTKSAVSAINCIAKMCANAKIITTVGNDKRHAIYPEKNTRSIDNKYCNNRIHIKENLLRKDYYR